ncbi:MAG: hypothetical protein ACOYMG_09375 [Candidatus Methylumidiphilus sp.]
MIFKVAFTSSLVSAVVGALFGYVSATQVPIQAQIAIIDIDKLIAENASPNADSGTQERISLELSTAIKTKAKELSSYGLIVLDGKAVINAPEESYATVER